MGTITRRRPGDNGTGGWEPPPSARRRGAQPPPLQRGYGGSGGGHRLSRSGLMAGHPVLVSLAVITTVAMVALSLGAYIVYRKTVGAIHHENVTSAMLGQRPPKLNGALNLLLIGSDSRAGTDGRFGHIAGARSDTAMLLHISPTHQRAVVLSFPRDSMVPVFACSPDGHGHGGQQEVPGQLEQLNATFSAGGAPCLWKTLEHTTHIRIDHFIEVNFLSFEKIVNDIGGVPVCLPYPVNDWRSHLRLSAGRHVIKGPEALAFVRVRHIGLGSDLQRIQRQQFFLASAVQQIKRSGVLTSPTGLLHLVHDVASSLTTDITNPATLLAVANSTKGLNPNALRFISVPVVPYPPNPLAWVQWAQPQSQLLFSAIAHDNHVPQTPTNGGKATPPATVSPAKVQLQVLNGSGTLGLAGTAASELTSRGFIVTGTGNAPSFSYTQSVIEYASPSQLPEVNTLKEQLTGVQVKQVSSLPPGRLDLILGSSFSDLSTKSGQSAQPAQSGKLSVSHLKGYGGISAGANICRDSAAFAGVGTSP
jgi:LCP family protein required for cell wall assembly